MNRKQWALAILVLCGFASEASADDRKWKATRAVESHASGDTFNPQVAVDHNGNALAVWQLTDGGISHIMASHYSVISKSWDPATTPPLDESNGSASSQQVAMDINGNAVAVWSQSDGVRAKRYTNGVWGAIKTLSGSGGSPQVAVDASGNAVVVWTQPDGSTRDQVWAARYNVGTGQWEAAAQLDGNIGHALTPQVAMDATGNAVAVWQQSGGGAHTDIVANRYAIASHGWVGAAGVETNARNAFEPQVAIGASGNARAIWDETDADGRVHVWSSRSTGGTSVNQWTEVKSLESNAANASLPQVVVDASGNAVAVWQQFNASCSCFNIWANRQQVSAPEWDSALRIQSDNSTDARSPSLALDANGNAVAVWHQVQPAVGVVGIYGARYTPSATLSASWAAAELIEHDDTGDAFFARVVFDGTGNATAVWYQFDGRSTAQHFTVASNRYATKEWSAPVPIETSQSRNAHAPHVAMDASGNALLMWEQSEGTGLANIRSKYFIPGSGWTDAVLVTPGNKAMADQSDLAVAANGAALAVWVQSGTNGRHVSWNRLLSFGANWGAPAPLEGGSKATTSMGPRVRFDPNGNALAVWEQVSEMADLIWSRHYTPSGWEGSLTMGASDASVPAFAFDSSGNALAVWSQFQGLHQHEEGSGNVLANKYTPGGGGHWGSAAPIETDNAGDALVPRIGVTPNGNALAIWSQSDGTRFNIMWNRYTGTWGAAAPLETDDAGGALTPTLALDSNGNALAIWSQSDGTHFHIRSNRWSSVDNHWEGVQPVETGTSDAQSPQVAFDANGNAVAVWNQSDDGLHFHMWSNRYTAGVGWGQPAQLDFIDGQFFGLNPRLAVDASGNAVAVWYQLDAQSVGHIWASRFE